MAPNRFFFQWWNYLLVDQVNGDNWSIIYQLTDYTQAMNEKGGEGGGMPDTLVIAVAHFRHSKLVLARNFTLRLDDPRIRLSNDMDIRVFKSSQAAEAYDKEEEKRLKHIADVKGGNVEVARTHSELLRDVGLIYYHPELALEDAGLLFAQIANKDGSQVVLRANFPMLPTIPSKIEWKLSFLRSHGFYGGLGTEEGNKDVCLTVSNLFHFHSHAVGIVKYEHVNETKRVEFNQTPAYGGASWGCMLPNGPATAAPAVIAATSTSSSTVTAIASGVTTTTQTVTTVTTTTHATTPVKRAKAVDYPWSWLWLVIPKAVKRAAVLEEDIHDVAIVAGTGRFDAKPFSLGNLEGGYFVAAEDKKMHSGSYADIWQEDVFANDTTARTEGAGGAGEDNDACETADQAKPSFLASLLPSSIPLQASSSDRYLSRLFVERTNWTIFSDDYGQARIPLRQVFVYRSDSVAFRVTVEAKVEQFFRAPVILEVPKRGSVHAAGASELTIFSDFRAVGAYAVVEVKNLRTLKRRKFCSWGRDCKLAHPLHTPNAEGAASPTGYCAVEYAYEAELTDAARATLLDQVSSSVAGLHQPSEGVKVQPSSTQQQ